MRVRKSVKMLLGNPNEQVELWSSRRDIRKRNELVQENNTNKWIFEIRVSADVGGYPSKPKMLKSLKSFIRCLAVYWGASNLPLLSQVQLFLLKSHLLILTLKIASGTKNSRDLGSKEIRKWGARFCSSRWRSRGFSAQIIADVLEHGHNAVAKISSKFFYT